MNDHSLRLGVVWAEPPDLIEIEVWIVHGEWSARGRAYASPHRLQENAERLIGWSRRPDGDFRLAFGSASGHLSLEFYTVTGAKHARCAISLLASSNESTPTRDAELSRLAIALPTELGLIERFGEECLSLAREFAGEAKLIGLPS